MSKEYISSEKNGRIVIELHSNPTTGYGWYAEASDGLSINDEYIPDRVEKGLCGSGGRQRFTITSEKKGDFELRLSYKRPWEPDECEVREYTLTFV